MTVWEFKPGNVNDYAPLVFTSDKDIESGMFDAEGEPLAWNKKPKIEVFVEPRKKKAQPLADIIALTPGALALNDKAKTALEPFLSQYGQLLEMDCEGQPRWFYNVTNVVSCIDEENSERRPTGALSKEEFFEDKVPTEAAVFKDPLTAPVKIYVNEAAKAALEALIADAALVGAAFVEPGPPPKRPRPPSCRQATCGDHEPHPLGKAQRERPLRLPARRHGTAADAACDAHRGTAPASLEVAKLISSFTMDHTDRTAPSRPLREQEVALIAALMAVSDDDSTRRIAEHQVADLADGGMGSIRFVADQARTLGRCVAEAKYLDGDGTVVSIALNLDAAGSLFELDIWKVDFSPLLKYPTPADLLPT